MASNFNTTLPPMSNKMDLGKDIQSEVYSTTDSDKRGRNPLPSANSSRESSLASSGHATPSHKRIDMDVVPKIEELNIKSLELSYETE